MAQRLKRLPGMRETRVRSLGREDPLEKEMAYKYLKGDPKIKSRSKQNTVGEGEGWTN